MIIDRNEQAVKAEIPWFCALQQEIVHEMHYYCQEAFLWPDQAYLVSLCNPKFGTYSLAFS